MANGNEVNSLVLINDMDITDVNSTAFCFTKLVKKITYHNDNVVRAGNDFAGALQDRVVL